MTTMAEKLTDRTIRNLGREKKIIKAELYDRAADPVRAAACMLDSAVMELFQQGYNVLEIRALAEVSIATSARYYKKRKAEVRKQMSAFFKGIKNAAKSGKQGVKK